jgi:hypothetical protein
VHVDESRGGNGLRGATAVVGRSHPCHHQGGSLEGGLWQVDLGDGKSLSKGFAQLAGASVDYTYGRRYRRRGGGVITVELLLPHGLQVKSWSRSPRRTAAGLGLHILRGDVVFKTFGSRLAISSSSSRSDWWRCGVA